MLLQLITYVKTLRKPPHESYKNGLSLKEVWCATSCVNYP